MDLEQTMRAAFVLREPAPDFEDVVMARLSAAAWRASQGAPRRRRHFLLIGALLAVSAAAAVLVARYSAPSLEPVRLPAPQVAVVAPPVVQHTALASVPVPPVSAPPHTAAPPTAPGAVDVSQPCNAAAAASPVPTAYTVLAPPPQYETDDPAIQSMLQAYYKGMIDQLRSMPGLGLVGVETRSAVTKAADYRITITAADSSGYPQSANPAEPRLKLQLDSWNGTAFKWKSATTREIRSLEASNCPQGRNCASIAGSTAVVIFLSNLLPRFPTSAQATCQHASQEHFEQQLAQQSKADPTFDLSIIRQQLGRLAATSQPTARDSIMMNMRRSSARLQLVEPLATALRESADDAFRKEAVTLLAVRFAGDPAAHEALAAVADSSADTLVRHVAERALSGDKAWRDYVVAGVRDTGLATTQRLEPLYWMVDAMPLDEQKMSATIADVLAELQKGDGMHLLADLLAGTQKEAGESPPSVATQQGRWTIRQIGSVDSPAAPDLLIACFDAVPNNLTLSLLATRRDDPRVTSKLESIAREQADPQLQGSATRYLRDPPDVPRAAPTGN